MAVNLEKFMYPLLWVSEYVMEIVDLFSMYFTLIATHEAPELLLLITSKIFCRLALRSHDVRCYCNE